MTSAIWSNTRVWSPTYVSSSRALSDTSRSSRRIHGGLKIEPNTDARILA
jgi:hypothetical protein